MRIAERKSEHTYPQKLPKPTLHYRSIAWKEKLRPFKENVK